MGVYSGFSPDMSTGMIFGVKLPTGDSHLSGFRSRCEIGSGSTDLLLGGYHTGTIRRDAAISNGSRRPCGSTMSPPQHGYTPGSELNGAAGVTYTHWHLSPDDFGGARCSRWCYRTGRGTAAMGDPLNTGYTRLLVSPEWR